MDKTDAIYNAEYAQHAAVQKECCCAIAHLDRCGRVQGEAHALDVAEEHAVVLDLDVVREHVPAHDALDVHFLRIHIDRYIDVDEQWEGGLELTLMFGSGGHIPTTAKPLLLRRIFVPLVDGRSTNKEKRQRRETYKYRIQTAGASPRCPHQRKNLRKHTTNMQGLVTTTLLRRDTGTRGMDATSFHRE